MSRLHQLRCVCIDSILIIGKSGPENRHRIHSKLLASKAVSSLEGVVDNGDANFCRADPVSTVLKVSRPWIHALSFNFDQSTKHVIPVTGEAL